jgi:hypothetical protein
MSGKDNKNVQKTPVIKKSSLTDAAEALSSQQIAADRQISTPGESLYPNLELSTLIEDETHGIQEDINESNLNLIKALKNQNKKMESQSRKMENQLAQVYIKVEDQSQTIKELQGNAIHKKTLTQSGTENMLAKMQSMTLKSYPTQLNISGKSSTNIQPNSKNSFREQEYEYDSDDYEYDDMTPQDNSTFVNQSKSNMTRSNTVHAMNNRYEDHDLLIPQHIPQQVQFQNFSPKKYVSMPKFIKQTDFSGKEGEDLEDWIFKIEMNFQVNRVEDDIKMSLAQFYLKDIAFLEFKSFVYKAIDNKVDLTWNMLVVLLRKRFRPINFEGNQFLKLINLKQTQGESVISYVEKVKKNLATGKPLH